jgi:transcriptional regulator with XRE-family HTH domain
MLRAALAAECERGGSQAKFAARIGTSQAHLSRLLRGDCRPGRLPLLRRFEVLWGIPSESWWMEPRSPRRDGGHDTGPKQGAA